MEEGSIKVFINPTCGPCNELKKRLNKKEINFIEKDLSADVAAVKEFRAMGGMYTPTTIIEIGERKFEVVGSNFEQIECILKAAPLYGVK